MPSRGVRHIATAVVVTVLSLSSVACLQELLNQFSPSDTTKTSTTVTTTGFRVTGATAGVDAASLTGTCPRRFTFTGTITASEAGTVTYKWERSDGSATPTETMIFAGAGAQTVVSTWELGASYTGWQKLHVLAPTDVLSNSANFALTCSATGTITGVVAAADSNSFTGTCPHTYTFTAMITATSATTISYRWERSDGTTSAIAALAFDGAGTQNVSSIWTVNGGTGWVRAHLLTPSDITSNEARISTTCQ